MSTSGRAPSLRELAREGQEMRPRAGATIRDAHQLRALWTRDVEHHDLPAPLSVTNRRVPAPFMRRSWHHERLRRRPNEGREVVELTGIVPAGVGAKARRRVPEHGQRPSTTERSEGGARKSFGVFHFSDLAILAPAGFTASRR